MKLITAKKNENIAEYILLMWQTEDLVRAYNFDINKIRDTVISSNIKNPEEKKDAVAWYEDIIQKMIFHNIRERGHLPENNESLMELSYVHNLLMNAINDVKYKQIFERALPDINEYQKVSRSEGINIIEACFNALYTKWMLKLKGEKLSDSTEKALSSCRNVVVYLARTYHKIQKGELNFHNN